MTIARQWENMNTDIVGLEAQVKCLQAQAAAMREALEALIDAVDDFHFSGSDDRSVKEWKRNGATLKTSYEQASTALAADAGREMLAKAVAMRVALHPLAALYHTRLDDLNDDAPLYQHCDGLITVGDVRRAKDALSADAGREMLERLRRAERERELTR